MIFYKHHQTAVLASVAERIKSRLSKLVAKKQTLIERQLKQTEDSQLDELRAKLGQKKS